MNQTAPESSLWKTTIRKSWLAQRFISGVCQQRLHVLEPLAIGVTITLAAPQCYKLSVPIDKD
jgi:hypothetical protein